MIDRTLLIQILKGLLAPLLAGIAAWLISHNIVDEGQWNLFLTGLASALVSLGLVVYQRYKGRLWFLTALEAESEEQVETLIAKR